MNSDQIRAIELEEYEHCKQDCLYFIENYVFIEDRDLAEIARPFKLWAEQKEAINSLLIEKKTIFLKSRQIGISWLVLAYGVWRMIFGGYKIMALSKGEEEAKELVRRMAFIFEHLDFAGRDGKQLIRFDALALSISVFPPNGLESVFKAFPSSPSAGASFTGNLLFFDEWALQAYARDIFKAAYPAINRPTGGQFIGVSTIERGTLFEDIWVDENNGFKKIFISWRADPNRNQHWYDDTLRTIGLDAMHSQYPETVEQALTMVGGSFFPEFKDSVHIRPQETLHNARYYIAMDYGLDMLSAGLFRIDDKGYAFQMAEHNQSNLVVSDAANAVLKLSRLAPGEIFCFIAPPDLWNRRQDTGRSAADIFAECGVPLYKATNNNESGCTDLKEWLRPHFTKNEQNGQIEETAYLTFSNQLVETIKSLKGIQKDQHNPNTYSKNPHRLTHAVDMLRYFCAGRPIPMEEIHDEDYREEVDPYECLINYGRR